MSVNRHQPHVLVLPEDDANAQVAIGFVLEVDQFVSRQIQVLPVAGGWQAVLDRFRSDYASDMRRFGNRHIVLLIDFDKDQARLQEVRNTIPAGLQERVFVLGAWDEPEGLKARLGNYEAIGSAMARDCRAGIEGIWGDPLL